MGLSCPTPWPPQKGSHYPVDHGPAQWGNLCLCPHPDSLRNEALLGLQPGGQKHWKALERLLVIHPALRHFPQNCQVTPVADCPGHIPRRSQCLLTNPHKQVRGHLLCLGTKSQLPALTQTGQSPGHPGLGQLSGALGLRGRVLARGSLPGSEGLFQVPGWGSPLSPLRRYAWVWRVRQPLKETP